MDEEWECSSVIPFAFLCNSSREINVLCFYLVESCKLVLIPLFRQWLNIYTFAFGIYHKQKGQPFKESCERICKLEFWVLRYDAFHDKSRNVLKCCSCGFEISCPAFAGLLFLYRSFGQKFKSSNRHQQVLNC